MRNIFKNYESMVFDKTIIGIKGIYDFSYNHHPNLSFIIMKSRMFNQVEIKNIIKKEVKTTLKLIRL